MWLPFLSNLHIQSYDPTTSTMGDKPIVASCQMQRFIGHAISCNGHLGDQAKELCPSSME